MGPTELLILIILIALPLAMLYLLVRFVLWIVKRNG